MPSVPWAPSASTPPPLARWSSPTRARRTTCPSTRSRSSRRSNARIGGPSLQGWAGAIDVRKRIAPPPLKRWATVARRDRLDYGAGGKMPDSAKPVVPLNILPPAPPPAAHWRSLALRLYRLGIVCAIVFIIHRHHTRLSIDGGAEVTPDEVRPFFPAAAKLDPDTSERRGLFVLDKYSNPVGYVLRTSPLSDSIKGYAGP